MMAFDRWDRVQSVFLSVADLPAGEQGRMLDAECGDDGALRAEIESLLGADRKSAENISSAITNEAALLFVSPDIAGSRLGTWRVVKEIGRGGMGVVYLAVRDDDQFQKQAAIKVVRHGMDTADVLGRFQYERQILANLDHPYIARLLDGGTTSDGRPFFVMDYVEGRPLDQFCRESTLDIEARCRLFLRILEAVSHAHRNLVVHRDLKPANIFVKSDGSPKLLDFGVAKLLAAELGAGMTLASLMRPFTPEYASPEQVRGLAVTTAVDIYSLGAVFYEMLTGERAQRVDSHSPAEFERIICQTEIRPPSALAKSLDGDLDNIVLMAMRKEPERRYQSVDQFAEDVRRYLSGQAVLARQDSFWYRTRKFAGRNRYQLAGAALIFASLLGALSVTLAQTRVAEAARGVAERERARAEAEYRKAELARANEAQQRLEAARQRDEAVLQRASAEQSVTQLIGIADKTLLEIHDAVARLSGATEARQALVKTTLRYLEDIQKEHGLDDRLRVSLAAGYSRIAAVLGDPRHPSLGDVKGAELNYRKAEDLLRPLYARAGNDPTVIMRWLEVESGLAGLAFAQSRSPQAIPAYISLLPAAHRLAELAPLNRKAVAWEAEIESAVATDLQSIDSESSLQHANKEIAILTTLIGRFPGDRDFQQSLGSALAEAASATKDLGKYEDAAEYFERSIAIREGFLKGEPHNAVVQRNLLVVYGNYCGLLGIPWLVNLGRPAEATIYCEKSVALARDLSAADPKDNTARYDLGVSLGQLGMVDPAPDQVEHSLKILEESLSILDPIGKTNPHAVGPTSRTEFIREYAGRRALRLGRLDVAEEYFRHSLSELDGMFKAHPGQRAGPIQVVSIQDGIAEIYALRGDRDRAFSLADEAVAGAEKYASGSSSDRGRSVSSGHLGEAYLERAWVERAFKEWDRAAADLDRAKSIWGSIADIGVLSVHRQARERAELLTGEIAARRAQ
jgi:eukaryotic-like serine/threonine-protein kinase